MSCRCPSDEGEDTTVNRTAFVFKDLTHSKLLSKPQTPSFLLRVALKQQLPIMWLVNESLFEFMPQYSAFPLHFLMINALFLLGYMTI